MLGLNSVICMKLQIPAKIQDPKEPDAACRGTNLEQSP